MLKHAEVWQAIDRLAARQGWSPSGLARRAGLDPTTFNKSKRVTAQGKQRWPSTESISKILEATDSSLADLVGLIGEENPEALAQRLPMITLGRAMEGELFDAAGAPRGNEWDEVLFPQVADKRAFALEVDNDSLLPIYRKSDLLIVSPGANLRRDDRLVVKLRSGEVAVRRLIRRSARRLELAGLTERQGGESYEVAEVEWLARIVWTSQ